MRKFLLLALVVGCSSSSTTAPNTGSLTVTVTAPGSITANVTITGPGGFTKTITSTTTLTGLTLGSYTIAAADVATKDPVVAAVYQGIISGSPVAISAGRTATASASYASRPGSGGLWVVGGTDVGSNTVSAAIQYTAAQLQASNSVAPATALTLPMTPGENINANAVAFDAHGNLWVVNDNTNTVVEYAASQLGASGSPTPQVTIQLPDSSYTDGFAFDANGDLWVSNQIPSTVVEFTPDQVRTSGSPTPAVTITIKDSHTGFPGYPLAVAFDAQGSLWVVNASSSVAKYTTGQLSSSGTPVPAVSVQPPVIFPYYAAFDTAGNLWLANAEYGNTSGGVTTWIPGSISEIAASSLAGSGSVSAMLTLKLPVGKNTAFPTAIAFDGSGDLWYTDAFNASVGEFTAAQLTAGGNPSPTITIVNTTPVFGTGLAFNPHATSLPLH